MSIISSRKETISTKPKHATFQSKFETVNDNISTLNKRISKNSSYQEHIENLLNEEIAQRQSLEKKTYVINETLTEQISRMKQTFDSLSSTFTSQIQNIKQEILNDVRDNNRKFLELFETNLKRFDEYESHLSNSTDHKNIKLHELENKITIIEETVSNQFTIVKTEIENSNSKINELQNKMINNSAMFNTDLSKIKETLTSLSNEIEKHKHSKTTINEQISQIHNKIDIMQTQCENSIHDINSISQNVKLKLNHYDYINQNLINNFNTCKGELLKQIDMFNKENNDSYIKLKDDWFREIKCIKMEDEKFRLNVIKENQKFIDFQQVQSANYNNNVKQMFDCVNEDVDVLKKKCVTLECMVKAIKNELDVNLTNVEGFVNNKCNEVMKSVNDLNNVFISNKGS